MQSARQTQWWGWDSFGLVSQVHFWDWVYQFHVSGAFPSPVSLIQRTVPTHLFCNTQLSVLLFAWSHGPVSICIHFIGLISQTLCCFGCCSITIISLSLVSLHFHSFSCIYQVGSPNPVCEKSEPDSVGIYWHDRSKTCQSSINKKTGLRNKHSIFLGFWKRGTL